MFITKNIKKATVIILLLPLHLLAQDDFSIIRKNIVENLQVSFTDAAILQQVVTYQPQQLTDGSWKDIDYKDSSITQWKPGTHLDRLKLFAIATTKPGNFYVGNTSLQSALISGLRFWYTQDAKSKNWWHNEIATPQTLGEIMLLLQSDVNVLPTSLQDSLVNRMNRGNVYKQTGANKLDVAMHYLYRACITKNSSLMDSAVSQAFQPISLTTAEGLQYDNSYMQHGAQLQISSYGLVFLSGEYKVASWLQGTAFALGGEKLKLLDNYLTHSFLKTIRGRYIDFNTEGRGISRPDILDKYSLVGKKNSSSLLSLAKKVNPQNSVIVDAAIQKISQTEPAGYGIVASHTHFWKGDYTIHLRKHYSFNVRTVSVRTKRTEAGNKENLLGKFLPDGSTNIQRSGAEYFNIMPIWEWDKIPGTTCREFATEQATTVQWGEAGSTSFVGGVSDGEYGLTTYNMDYNDVKAKKSYFFFDKEIVCLGTGINSNSDENITTTINQCWLNGDTKVSIDSKTENVKKINNYTNPAWVWHDSIGYFFPSNTEINISTQSQKGSWSLINASRSKDELKGNVFKLWISHNAKPSNASYAYIVVPEIGVNEMQRYNKNEVKVLQNTNAIQAVKHNGLNMAQIVFHEAGTITDSDFSVTVNQPCVVLLKNVNSKIVSMYVADPSQKNSEVNIVVKTSMIHGENKINCKLPSGNFAGSSAEFTLK